MSKNRRRQQQAQVSEQATVTSSDIMTPEEIAAERAMLIEQARRDLEAPKPEPKHQTNGYSAGKNKVQHKVWGPTPNPNSIRQIIRRSLLEGKSTKEIGEVLKAEHPDSMAAKKVTQHVAFYRSKMRKAGELPRKA